MLNVYEYWYDMVKRYEEKIYRLVMVEFKRFI